MDEIIDKLYFTYFLYLFKHILNSKLFVYAKFDVDGVLSLKGGVLEILGHDLSAWSK